MAYYTNLFTPETWENFRTHGESLSGFRVRQRRAAERINSGDLLLCYLVRLSRWCGILEVKSEVFVDASPVFADPDPFVIRLKVAPVATFDLEHSIPIFEEEVWSQLSLTKDLEPRAFGWAQTANLRSSLRELSEPDGKLPFDRMIRQQKERTVFPLTAQDKQRLSSKKAIRTADRAVIVRVPEEGEVSSEASAAQDTTNNIRDSHRIQGTIARVGAEMGFRIWVPRSDKQKIFEVVPENFHPAFLDILPLNYDEVTLRTIEDIDVIWLKNRSMARAFEVEHTTAIYSGLLRMADLLALQPNMDICLHVVAPSERRDKVLREITRPVFSLLDRGPLYESCSYIPYEAIDELASMKHLGHMSDTILDEYEEFAQDE